MNRDESSAVARITLRMALKQLPKPQYDAYVYVEVMGYTTREAGTILGVDQKTVSRRNTSAKASLKTILSGTASK